MGRWLDSKRRGPSTNKQPQPYEVALFKKKAKRAVEEMGAVSSKKKEEQEKRGKTRIENNVLNQDRIKQIQKMRARLLGMN